MSTTSALNCSKIPLKTVVVSGVVQLLLAAMRSGWYFIVTPTGECVNDQARRANYYGTSRRQTGSSCSEGNAVCLVKFRRYSNSIWACSKWCSERSSTLQWTIGSRLRLFRRHTHTAAPIKAKIKELPSGSRLGKRVTSRVFCLQTGCVVLSWNWTVGTEEDESNKNDGIYFEE